MLVYGPGLWGLVGLMAAMSSMGFPDLPKPLHEGICPNSKS